MHPLRRLRELGKPTAAQVSEPAGRKDRIQQPILIRPAEGREVCAAIFAQEAVEVTA